MQINTMQLILIAQQQDVPLQSQKKTFLWKPVRERLIKPGVSFKFLVLSAFMTF